MSFSALTGGGVGGAYQPGDKWGAQTAEKVRTNFNDHETRVVSLETATAGASIAGLTDVGLTSPLSDGEVLTYDSGSGLWENAAPAVSDSSSNTFTNKTLNAESTGNIITLPFTVFWPAAVCDNSVPYSPLWSCVSGATAPTATNITGSNITSAELEFVDGATNSIWIPFVLPSDWTGALDLRIFWRCTATSGNVVWQVQTGGVVDGGVVDVALNAAQTVTDAAQGSASRFNTASLSSLTLTGLVAGGWMWLRLFRDPSHASDTLGASAFLLGAEMKYRRAM